MGKRRSVRKEEPLNLPSEHPIVPGWTASWHWNESALDAVPWDAWDQLIADSNRPSVFLDSRMMQSLLSAKTRNVAALIWRKEGQLKGLALVEDAQAESVNLAGHIESRSWVFDTVSRLLHGKSGRWKFSVRVIGTTLGSGDHGFRFASDIVAEQQQVCLEKTMFRSPSNWGNAIPRVVMVKDKAIPAERTKTPLFRGWTPLEFDPEMVVNLDPSWQSLDDCMPSLVTKARTKFKRIQSLSKDFQMESWSAEQLESQGQDLIELYRLVFERSGFRLGSLHLDELVASKRFWGDAFVVLVYSLEGEQVGFQCAYATPEATEAFFVGFKPELTKSHAIYQRMLLEFMGLGIASGSREVRMGRTALDVKSSIGALPRRLQCDVKFRNPMAHAIVHAFTKGYAPVHMELKRSWKADAFPVKRHSEITSVHPL